jgi:hypothetical protein
LGPSHDPVQDIHEAVGTKCDEVEGIDDSRNRGLTEEEQLRDDANGFEDFGKDP